MKNIYTFAIFFFALSVISGQNNSLDETSYNIQLQNEVISIDKNIDVFEWNQMPASSNFQNGYFGWIQFHETPNQETQNEFKRRGLELIEYIPNKAYVFYFPENTPIQYLKDSGVRAIVPIKDQFKVSSELSAFNYPEHAIEGDNVLVMLKFHKHINSIAIIRELSKYQVDIKQEFEGYNILELSIPTQSISTVASLPYIKWIEPISPPDQTYDDQGRSLQRSNSLDTQTPNGRNYTGEGMGVLVRDNGVIGELSGPHIDFKGRLNDLTSQSDPNINFHSDAVAGIFAGAGNLDPRARGMAAGATIHNVSLGSSFLDNATTTLINSGTVQITNTSSGSPCQNGYTLNAVTVDQQTKDIPTLLHVLSAGNVSSTEDCGYGAGPGWGILGGANKTGKNMIAAANVRFDGSIVPSSAKGPAADGRIKPDLSAMGAGQVSTDENNQYFTFSGTSASSPAIAGLATQLYEAYSDKNNGTLPQSALIKAALLNTTNEAGNIGPDYTYGWGIVNGLRAVKVIEEETYLSDEITQGSTNNHTINIPIDAAQVRFMVYWSDVPGAEGANRALVNDLDLVVSDPSDNILLPWILDPTPNPVALNTPATNGPDHLNNMEQVQINNPAPGDYTLDISGFNVPIGPQEYFVVYEIITDRVVLTHPNGGESFVPGETEIIHWDATNTIENFNIEYSVDEGDSWMTIATVPGDITNYSWDVPSLFGRTALIRVTSGDYSDISDASFSIVSQVEGFDILRVCPSEVTFIWDELAGAESYDIYLLGEKYMDIVGNSETTTITVPITDPTVQLWAAIVAKNDSQNWASRRTFAINNADGVKNCELNDDITLNEILNNPVDLSTPCNSLEGIVVSISLSNTGTETQSNFEVSYQLNNENQITEIYNGQLMPGESITYDFEETLDIPDPDDYTLTATVRLTGDQNQFNDAATLSFSAITNTTNLDFTENFQGGLVQPEGWSIINNDERATWTFTGGIIGSDGNTTNAAFLNNGIYEAEGEEDILITEYIDLTDITNGATLSFDIAKTQWSPGLQDGLRVEISVDCGQSFITIYQKDDLELSTVSNYLTVIDWEPNVAEEWRKEEIDMTPYQGEIIQIRFININGFGNSTYIDNISLIKTSLVNTVETTLSDFKLYPNPAIDRITISLESRTSTDASAQITNNLGQIVLHQAFKNSAQKTIDISKYTPGLYFVTVTTDGISKTKKVFIE